MTSASRSPVKTLRMTRAVDIWAGVTWGSFCQGSPAAGTSIELHSNLICGCVNNWLQFNILRHGAHIYNDISDNVGSVGM